MTHAKQDHPPPPRLPYSIDLSQVSHKEYLLFFMEGTPQEEKDAIWLKMTGISAADSDELPEPLWRQLMADFRAAVLEPVEATEKNLPSESI